MREGSKELFTSLFSHYILQSFYEDTMILFFNSYTEKVVILSGHYVFQQLFFKCNYTELFKTIHFSRLFKMKCYWMWF